MVYTPFAQCYKDTKNQLNQRHKSMLIYIQKIYLIFFSYLNFDTILVRVYTGVYIFPTRITNLSVVPIEDLFEKKEVIYDRVFVLFELTQSSTFNTALFIFV